MTELAKLASPKVVAVVILTVFLLGFAPVLVARCLARIYPKGHPRRNEIPAEIAYLQHVNRVLSCWHWLGSQFALALCEGIPLRCAASRRTLGGHDFRLTLVRTFNCLWLVSGGVAMLGNLPGVTLPSGIAAAVGTYTIVGCYTFFLANRARDRRFMKQFAQLGDAVDRTLLSPAPLFLPPRVVARLHRSVVGSGA